ncbi:MAG: hypothetical protein MI921_22475 [Cytophagales bacterium]|nr:hypothetical protein [Cytophagales bacterium]
MDPKVSKEKIIAYLYGELSEEEAGEVATYLQNHPLEAAEYEGLQQLRGTLQNIKDIEVTQPVIMLGNKPGSYSFLNIFQNRFFQKVASAAAVFVIGLILAKVTGLNLTYSNQALTIAFSKNQVTPAISPQNPGQEIKTVSNRNDSTQQQLMEKVNALLIRENRILTRRLASLEFDVKVLENEARRPAVVASEEIPGGDQQDMEELARKISEQNLQLFSEVVKASQVQQEAYIKSLFSEFAIYLQSQRVEDLRKIEASLESLKQDSDLKKLETDQVIASLIQTVKDKNY